MIKGVAGTGGLQIANRILLLVLGILLARNLGVEGYGVYGFCLAVMNLLLVPTLMGMPIFVMREIASSQAKNNFAQSRGLFHRATQFVVCSSLVVLVTGLLVVEFLGQSLSPATKSTLVVMLFVLPLIALSRVFASIIRGFQKPVLAQMFELVVRPVLVITIVLVGFGLFLDLRTPEFAMFGQLTAGLVIAVSSLYVVHRICFANTDSERPEYQTRKWLKSALPFTLISGASVAGDQFLTILVGWLGSTADVGLYRVTIQGSAVVTFGYAAIVSVVSPHMTRLYVQKDSRKLEKLVKTSTRAIVLLAFPVVLLLVIAGGDLAAWVFGPDFRECGLALAVLSVFTLIGMSLGPTAMLLNMVGHEQTVVKVIWSTTLGSILLSLLLVPQIGFFGAVIAMCAGILIKGIVLFRVVRKYLRFSPGLF